eukprot:TRINITY_DN8135_c0_g1_i1.p2 TRINITY_DN8135_c0_g1~~TRINITY_DN8135_c0_g1_i1.p2  ORF type:complete len:389 (+),score=63.32 TRINITY_DN8135_c0_g1_i1:1605-2771(+)
MSRIRLTLVAVISSGVLTSIYQGVHLRRSLLVEDDPNTKETEVVKPVEAVVSPTLRECKEEGEYTKGKWVLDESRRKYLSYDGIGKTPGCCGMYAKANKLERTAPLYKWVPSTCRISSFNEELFCKALKGRNIIFVGDSIQELWHFAILHELGIHADYTMKEGTAGRPKCPKHPICGKYYRKPLMLRHITNQFLTFTSTRRVNRKWWTYIKEFEIVVVNSGAWMVKPEEMRRNVMVPVSDAKYKQHMTRAAAYLKDSYNGTVIFRTTHPGHPNCESATGPLETPHPRPYPSKYNNYRWEAIFDRNEVAKEIFKAINASILDIEPMTTLRPDGHLAYNHPNNWRYEHGKAIPNFVNESKRATDCLHYCTPGPMDTWSQLLMNMLLGEIK